MKKVSIDTNVYVGFKLGNEDILKTLRKCEVIGIDVTVIAELLSGFVTGSKTQKNISELEEFLATSRVQILEHNFNTSEYYAHIFKVLKNKGTPIPTNDLWIAASSIQNGLALYTLDKHFEKIEGLLLVNAGC
jgi:tRNA(fMet)-specific endonuclease VapC